MKTCAVLGPVGSFSEEAALFLYGDEVELRFARTIDEVFAWVEENRTDMGLVPLENSLSGAIRATLRNLLKRDVLITREIYTPIEQCLIACREYELKDLRLVVSQLAVFEQCQNLLSLLHPDCRWEIVPSTSRAAEIVRGETRPSAAIGTRRVAELLGMKVLLCGVQDSPDNHTRFVEIQRQKRIRLEEAAKTSIFFAVEDKPGALYEILKIFALRKVNLSKLESILFREMNGLYLFFTDIDGGLREGVIREVVDEVERRAAYFKLLGSYGRVER